MILLVGGGVGSFLLLDVEKKVQSEQRDTLIAEADLQEDTVSTLVRDLKVRSTTVTESVESIRRQASIRSAARQEIRKSFTAQAERDEATGSLHLVDAKSRKIVVSSEPDAMGESVSTLGYAIPV